MSIVMSVIDVATAQAEEVGSKRIRQIDLEIGALAGVMVDSLTFCFDAASKNSIAEGARLNIISIPGEGKCLKCQKTFPVETFFALCPQCKGYHVEIIQGKDLRLRSIEVD